MEAREKRELFSVPFQLSLTEGVEQERGFYAHGVQQQHPFAFYHQTTAFFAWAYA